MTDTSKKRHRHEYANRFPPGQKLVSALPVLDIGIHPEIDRESWRLDISGEVANPCSLSFQDLLGAGTRTLVSDLHCVTGWSVPDVHLFGIPMTGILKTVDTKPSGRFAVLEGADGMKTNLPLDILLKSMLVTEIDGEPLSIEHGFPVRLMAPDRYLWKSIKWLTSIRISSDDEPGFWEQNGYHNEGDPWKEQRWFYQP